MKFARLRLIWGIGVSGLFVFLVAFHSAVALEAVKPEMSRDSLLTAARAVIDSTRYCIVTTLDENHSPRVRPMDPFPPERDMTIWLGTNINTRKVADIRRDPAIALCYLMPSGMGYVSLYGKAELVNDSTAKEKWWKPEWAGFYPNKDRDFILIKVVPIRIEVINYSLGVEGDLKTWIPQVIEFNP
jgi:general stress protein 26